MMYLGIYITGIVIGYIGAAVMLWWEIKTIKEMKTVQRQEFGNPGSEGGLKKIYKPFIIWIYSFVFFALLLIGLFCTFMLGAGHY